MKEDLKPIPKNATAAKRKLKEIIKFENKFYGILQWGTVDKFEDLTAALSITWLRLAKHFQIPNILQYVTTLPVENIKKDRASLIECHRIPVN